MSSGSMWYNVPQLRLEDHLLLANRLSAVEQWVDTLESMFLKHARGTGHKHTTCECACHAVPRETEKLDANSIYYQTLIDLAAPEAGVGPESNDG